MRIILLLSAALIPGLCSAATLESFDVPGAYGTCGSAIASNGLVAGNTIDPYAVVGSASRAVGSAAPVVAPFLYFNGRLSYPRVNMPAGMVTFMGVNKYRVITASTFNNSVTGPLTTNFLYHQGQVTLPSAGSLPVTGLSGITDYHVLLGQSQTTPTGEFSLARTFGFVLANNGQVTIIDDGSSDITPRAMDAKAYHVVGTALGKLSGGWVFAAGVFKPVSYPGNTFTLPTGVDEKGTITGSYVVIPATGNTSPSHGFFLRHGVYTTYDVPLSGVTATAIEGMNEAGQITGCYTDAKGTHGFLQTP
jgi:hypothetical protein